MLLHLALESLFGIAVSASDPIVKALLGSSGSPGIVPIAHTAFIGAVWLRVLEEGYSWMMHGDFQHMRNIIFLCAGGLALEHAPIMIGAITGIIFPTLF